MGICCGCLFFQEKYRKIRLGNELLEKLLIETETHKRMIAPDTVVVVLKLISISNVPSELNVTGFGGQLVEVKLSPPDKYCGEQLQRSSFKPYHQRSVWEPPERFQFVTTLEQNAKIVFSVYQYNPLSEATPLGDSFRHVGKLDNKSLKNTAKLLHPVSGKHQGEIEFELRLKTYQEASEYLEQEVYELERRLAGIGWGHRRNQGFDPEGNICAAHYLPGDPMRWQLIGQKGGSDTLEDIIPPLPPNWFVVKDWHTQATMDDPDGWEYSHMFSSISWFPPDTSVTYVCRRRRWFRIISSSNEGLSNSDDSSVESRDKVLDLKREWVPRKHLFID